MKSCKTRRTIKESTARRIEAVAAGKMRGGAPMHRALTAAAKQVLRCKPRAAIAGEGSRNYIQAVGGRILWGE